MIYDLRLSRAHDNLRLVVGAGAEECASIAASEIETALGERTNPVLGVATGATPRRTYELLVERGVSSDGVHLVLLDEYIGLAPCDRRGFAATIRRRLAEPLGIPPDRIHVPPVGRDQSHEPCEAFERELRDLGGVDLQVLGIGQNGHIAFNEPGSPLDSRTRVVRLSRLTRENNRSLREAGGNDDRAGEVPERACTQGIATILEARRLMLLATGERKAGILADAMLGPIDPEVPASAIRLHPDVTVIADVDAARLLPVIA